LVSLTDHIQASVGQFAIQIAKFYGLTVATTCSPRHQDQAKAFGADHVFDYNDEEVAVKIKDATNGSLKFVFDTIGNESSSSTASKAISEEGGTLCTVRPGKAFTETVTKQTKVTDVLVWTAFLKDHSYGDFHWPVGSAGHRHRTHKTN
jgi:NADPH:quinone reductase-like Zn-dependent oxidoreductase